MKKGIILFLFILSLSIFTACNSAIDTSASTSTPVVDADTEENVAETETTLVEIAYPSNGYVFHGNSDACICPLEIVTQGEDAYYIKLITDASGDDVLAFFVQPGQNIEVAVPLGTYQIKYACGTTWYGESELFGPDTAYYLADDVFEFTEDEDYVYGYTLELYEQYGGNLNEIELNAASF
jgi:hypothetical protein